MDQWLPISMVSSKFYRNDKHTTTPQNTLFRQHDIMLTILEVQTPYLDDDEHVVYRLARFKEAAPSYA